MLYISTAESCDQDTPFKTIELNNIITECTICCVFCLFVCFPHGRMAPPPWKTIFPHRGHIKWRAALAAQRPRPQRPRTWQIRFRCRPSPVSRVRFSRAPSGPVLLCTRGWGSWPSNCVPVNMRARSMYRLLSRVPLTRGSWVFDKRGRKKKNVT